MAAHYVTNYSFGLAILPFGVIFAALGVFSGDKAPKVTADAFGNQVQVIPKVRVKTAVLAVIAIVFIAIAYALFNGVIGSGPASMMAGLSAVCG